jgi:hypothetical protein
VILALEAETPRMFLDVDEKDGNADRTPEEILARQTARFARQTEVENNYLTRVDESGLTYLVDLQYSPYFWCGPATRISRVTACPGRTFTGPHVDRVRSYAGQLKPAYYEVVNEPSAYNNFSGIAEPGETDVERLDAWIAHPEELVAAVREVSPDTRIGVGISLADDFDLDYYERVLAVDGIDFVSFRVFQPAALDRITDVFAERGSPADAGKSWIISETWYGYCLAPQRSMALDGDWLKVAVEFGAEYGAAAVLPTDFGCFIEPGGTLFGDMGDPANRTEVYQAWADLAAQWNAPGQATDTTGEAGTADTTADTADTKE